MNRVKLGSTDLQVGRIGIGGGNGISAEDVEYAINLGVNYIFVSCDLHSESYRGSQQAVRSRSRGPRRDEIVVVACSYVNDPEKIYGVLSDHLICLNLDHVDVFQWGWLSKWQAAPGLLAATRRIVNSTGAQNFVQQSGIVAKQVEADLRCRGYARYLGVSTHDRDVGRALLEDSDLDVLMLRYNRDHTGAETDVFQHLTDSRPGIVAFNTCRGDGFSPTERYAFALNRPEIDVVLTGPGNRHEIDAAIAALDI